MRAGTWSMALAAFLFLGMLETSRAGILNARINYIHEGMLMNQVLSLLGTPSKSKQGPGSKVTLFYSDTYPPKTWAISGRFHRGAVA